MLGGSRHQDSMYVCGLLGRPLGAENVSEIPSDTPLCVRYDDLILMSLLSFSFYNFIKWKQFNVICHLISFLAVKECNK
jgi:hypothetical protein